jgi:hypothetical protein
LKERPFPQERTSCTGLPGEFHIRKNTGPFNPNGIQRRWIEVECFEDRGSHLRRANAHTDCLGYKRRIRQQQNDIGVVVAKAAVFGKFRFAAGVSDADIRSDDDVRSPRVLGRVVVVEREGGTVVNLAQANARAGRGVVFQNLDAGRCIRRALQPNQRDVIFRWPNARRVIGGLRIRYVARIGE